MGYLGQQPYMTHFGIEEIYDVWSEGCECLENTGKPAERGASSIKDAAAGLKEVAKELNIPLEQVIQIYIGLNISRLCAMKRIDSDKMDENLAGLGDKLDDVVNQLDSIRMSM